MERASGKQVERVMNGSAEIYNPKTKVGHKVGHDLLEKQKST